MGFWSNWFEEYTGDLAGDTYWSLKQSVVEKGEVTKEELLKEAEKLHREVQKMKAEGFSVWSAKSKIPKAFDIIDGAFVLVTEVIKKLPEKKE